MRHHHAAGPGDRLGDSGPVVGCQRAQVEHHDADAPLGRALGREQRPLHEGTPGDHHDVGAVPPNTRAPERDLVVRSAVDRFAVDLTIQMLVLEKQDRVVAPDRRSEQTGGVIGITRVGDPQPRAVREDALTGLAVVKRSAAQLPADRRTDDERAGIGVDRPIP